MDTAGLRENGRKMIDFIIKYHQSMKDLPVTPNVKPGYMRELVPMETPQTGENFDNIMKDLDTVIMPGVTHWLHPQFHGELPNGFSYVSLLADLLCDGIPNIGFSWVSSPACTEVETIMLEWLGKMIGLPEEFLNYPENSVGGGCLQNSASDCDFVCMLVARSDKIKQLQQKGNKDPLPKIAGTLVAYASKEAHPSLLKLSKLALVQLKLIEVDDQCRLPPEALEEAIENDLKEGLNPFFVVCTLGTFASTACDSLKDIGPICSKHELWLHVDAAYVGSAFICEEYRYLMEGIQHAESFAVDPTQWLPIIVDGAAMWVRNQKKVTQSFVVDPLYLQHKHEKDAIDYRNWGVHLSRRFRGLKYWFTIRLYGTKKLQEHIRNQIELAKFFENLVKGDDRFEIKNEVKFGFVCFRMKGDDKLNEDLLKKMNDTKKVFLANVTLRGEVCIRFIICHEHSTQEHMNFAWNIIKECADGMDK